MSYETCSQCGQAQYQETSINDDWDGVLHCPNCNHEVKRYQEQEEFGVLSDLGIRFQEAVLNWCNEYELDVNNISEEVWNELYAELSEESFDDLVKEAMDTASGLWVLQK